MIEPVGYLATGVVAIGMALSFWAADPKSPTSRALSLFWVLLGITWLANIPAEAFRSNPALRPWGVRFFSTAEALILATGLEWAWRVMRTQIAADSRLRQRSRWIRAAQGLALLYGIIGLLFGELQIEVWKVPWQMHLLERPGFYLFALPFFSALALPVVPFLGIRRGNVDPAEALRIVSMVAASPFWIAGMTVPMKWKPVGFAIGEAIFLVGAIRYHVLQGQRGQFLARFLSPQVARMVRERGLAAAMQETRLELSVVVCDLRGFTAFSETAAAEEVVALLREYYATMGDAVSEFGGTIKDYAGDGILTLVGAPIPYPDHADRALAMGKRMREHGSKVLSSRGLGLGVGIASGQVTVGALGSTERLEYVAVGPAVNLASRLCTRADADQILVDDRTVSLIGQDGPRHRLESLEAVDLKGFARPIAVHALVA